MKHENNLIAYKWLWFKDACNCSIPGTCHQKRYRFFFVLQLDLWGHHIGKIVCVCVCACVRACMRVCVSVFFVVLSCARTHVCAFRHRTLYHFPTSCWVHRDLYSHGLSSHSLPKESKSSTPCSRARIKLLTRKPAWPPTHCRRGQQCLT